MSPLSADKHRVIVIPNNLCESVILFHLIHSLFFYIRSREYHQVIIIGAGMAGLGAATKLLENRIKDFVILDAQSQPGGRIKTIFVDGKPLDLGAQWMHGKDNPLYHLAKQHSLLSEEVSEEGVGRYLRSNGDVVDSSTVQLVSFKFGQILERCSKLAEAEERTLNLLAYLKEHFNHFLDEQALNREQEEIYRELFDWNVRFQVVDNSCMDLSRLSTKRWGDYVCEDDEAHSNLKFGYQSLVDAIVESFPRQCSIRCDNEVVQIGADLQSGVVLETKNGDLLMCDHLILTPSLGVLKTSDFLKKVLPEKMLTNIENMGFAGISKIFLFYDQKWWGDAKGFQLLWGHGFHFQYDAKWLMDITGFDLVFNHENALMTWVGGCSVEEVEHLDPELIGTQCTQLLQHFLKKHLPLPNKVIRTRWQSNPFIQGSYCHITPECDAPDSGIAVLKEPVLIQGVPRVVLAGEAVHQTHYSTTHGAFESGLDQAQIICDFVDSKSNN